MQLIQGRKDQNSVELMQGFGEYLEKKPMHPDDFKAHHAWVRAKRFHEITTGRVPLQKRRYIIGSSDNTIVRALHSSPGSDEIPFFIPLEKTPLTFAFRQGFLGPDGLNYVGKIALVKGLLAALMRGGFRFYFGNWGEYRADIR